MLEIPLNQNHSCIVLKHIKKVYGLQFQVWDTQSFFFLIGYNFETHKFISPNLIGHNLRPKNLPTIG